MAVLTVYSPAVSNRLRYVLDWLLTEVLHTSYEIVTDKAQTENLPFFLSYGELLPNAVSIACSGTLRDGLVREHEIPAGRWKDLPTLYASEPGYTIPFDLFAALFFLLSRYEEYLGFRPDKHGRFPPEASILCRRQLLERPIVDEWIYQLYTLLRTNYNVPVQLDNFRYQPSYDIDIAYSYRYKGWQRTAGGLARDLLGGRSRLMAERLSVLTGKASDPFDAFAWMRNVHISYGLKPIYFVLAAKEPTDFDKNILPGHPAMQALIRGFSREGTVGIHPSYYSGNVEKFSEERTTLEAITGRSVTDSRQHYVRLLLPDTYELLIRSGIENDWSMGYGSRLGFRAGTGRSFHWYDLRNERPTALRVHPFCFMDSTAHFEERLSPQESFLRLIGFREILKKTHSQLTTVFHNFSLGTDPQWAGWPEAYDSFLAGIK